MSRHVLGRPVTGEEPSRRDPRVKQWPAERFLELLDNVLAVPEVEAVKWTQYTPYFNDGEPCEFGVGEAYVRIAGDDEEAGDFEDGFVSSYEMGTYNRDTKDYEPKPGYEAVFAPYKELARSMSHFEDFLSVSFGDHAEITATKSGFHLASYEHD